MKTPTPKKQNLLITPKDLMSPNPTTQQLKSLITQIKQDAKDQYMHTPIYNIPKLSSCASIPKVNFSHRKTLVLDLDETLVHSSFQPLSRTDIVLPVF